MRTLRRLYKFVKLDGDRWGAIRRHGEMLIDQAWVLSTRRWAKVRALHRFDANPRFALLTVNFSTTRYLKLMLLTLSQQPSLSLLHRIILVENDNRDGGLSFSRRLAGRVPRIHLVENSFFPTHARGLRLARAALLRVESDLDADQQCNVLIPCDTDVIFRERDVLSAIADIFRTSDAAFAGELRRGVYPYPEAQASFFAVRRDHYDDPRVWPFVHHGAPAYWMQRSLHRLGLSLHDFPSNHGGYILHRGRAGVRATKKYRPFDAHATTSNDRPHFMGIPGGEQIWAATERRWEQLLTPQAEPQLLDLLVERFAQLGSVSVAPAHQVHACAGR